MRPSLRNLAFCRQRPISILDSVYEHISLLPSLVAVVDTPEFQRLRGLKQLGASSFLYPCAVHTRFEHSLGVAHLTGELLNGIRHRQPELGITADDVEVAMIAAACHDIGHGPFSHLFEDLITHSLQTAAFTHEIMGSQLAKQMLTREGIFVDRIDEVLALMAGRRYAVPSNTDNATTLAREIPYFQVLCNKRGGLDTDKLDYLLRDSLCCFGRASSNLRVNRLFNAMRVVETGPDNRLAGVSSEEDAKESQHGYTLAFEQKMAVTLREIFSLRASMHKVVYQHHVVKAVGHMISDIFANAAESVRIDGTHTLTQCVTTPELFLLLGDWVLDAVGAAEGRTAQLREAQRVLKRLRTRDLYSLAASATFQEAYLDAGGYLPSSSEVKEQLAEVATTTLGPHVWNSDNVIVEIVKINHGAGSRDPLSSLLFFNPKEIVAVPSKCRCFSAPASSAVLSPLRFEEHQLFVFSRERARTTEVANVVAAWRKGYAQHLLRDGMPFHNPRIAP